MKLMDNFLNVIEGCYWKNPLVVVQEFQEFITLSQLNEVMMSNSVPCFMNSAIIVDVEY